MVTKIREKNRVLIVEDDPSAREASRLYLEHCGYDVMAAPNAEAAFRLALKNVPDVIVCDWHLGGGPSGVDVARCLQSEHGMPVIFMTAYPVEELREAANDIDIVCVLKKPLSLPVLVAALAEL